MLESFLLLGFLCDRCLFNGYVIILQNIQSCIDKYNSLKSIKIFNRFNQRKNYKLIGIKV